MALNHKTVVHWFRKGLRIHDNPALVEAIKVVEKDKCFLRPIFILDPLILKWLLVGPNRWRFLQQSLEDLDNNLRNIGSGLYVVRGNPEEIFSKIIPEWNVSLLTFEVDIEPYAKDRDNKIENICKQLGVRVLQKVSHTIYDTETVILKNLGKPPLTYQKFLSVTQNMGKIPQPLPAPDKLPEYSKPPADTENNYKTPTLSELNVNEGDLGECLYPGGETEALRRLEECMSKKDWVCNFQKPNTSPNSLEPSTTVLSPYLKFGCLSARLFHNRLEAILKTRKHTKPPVSLVGQLMWREFYYVAAAGTPNFDRMAGNPVCVQVPWDTDAQRLEAWRAGRTGYPFIDAIMRQLRHEGWIHHLARHAVACFLTRGDLWISWEEGQRVFEEYLLDADWALNAGNWLWLSASAFFHQFFRVYSPVAFGKKTDKDGAYIKKYVPELRKFPCQYVYEPWTAPLSVQRAAGCLVGQDYPRRVVVHEEIHKKNIAHMAAAYKANKALKESADSDGNKAKNTAKRTNKSGAMEKFVKRSKKK